MDEAFIDAVRDDDVESARINDKTGVCMMEGMEMDEAFTDAVRNDDVESVKRYRRLDIFHRHLLRI